jgi:hypothetical protein
MGHASIQTTEVYANYLPDARQAELVERAFGGAVTNPVTKLTETDVTSDDLGALWNG